MIEKKLWEINISYTFFKDIESYFKYLIDNNLDMTFVVKERFTPSDNAITEDLLDNIALKKNLSITYTDEEHPIALFNSPLGNNYINPAFYEAHKEEFKAFALKRFKANLANKAKTIIIPDFIYSDELIDEIINENGEELSYYLSEFSNNEIALNEEIKKKIKENHLEFNINHRYKKNESISTKYILGYHTINDLKALKNYSLDIPTDRESISNLIYLNEDAVITIDTKYGKVKDEAAFYNSVISILKDLSTHNKHYNIKIEVKNRELLRRSNLLSNIPANVNLTIFNDLYDYDIETYKQEEDKLESLIGPIRDSNLSPFEKYLAVYDIAKKFKPYKENADNPEQARYLRYLLDDKNEYIVCGGFANILQEFLNRVGIPNKKISLSVDISYDNGYTQEDKTLSNVGHARNLIKLDDDKYNIHGFYLGDSTWDNHLEADLYLNSLITFDKKKEAYRLETLTDEDLLFDYHNFDEFQAKMNYLFKKESKDYKQYEFEKQVIYSYDKIYHKIMTNLDTLDHNIYVYFFNKYNDKITNHHTNIKEYEQVVSEFLTEYGNYVIGLSNKKIELDTIIYASANIKREINHETDEAISNWIAKTKAINETVSKHTFPYKYDPNNNREAYVETEEEKKEHTK